MSSIFDKHLAEMPREVMEKAVEHLRDLFTEDTKEELRMAYTEDSETWWASSHHGWGTAVRNSLRASGGLSDSLLPDGHWDDYYIPCVEIAIGVREMPSAEVV